MLVWSWLLLLLLLLLPWFLPLWLYLMRHRWRPLLRVSSVLRRRPCPCLRSGVHAFQVTAQDLRAHRHVERVLQRICLDKDLSAPWWERFAGRNRRSSVPSHPCSHVDSQLTVGLDSARRWSANQRVRRAAYHHKIERRNLVVANCKVLRLLGLESKRVGCHRPPCPSVPVL